MPHSVHILVCPHPVVFHRTHRLLAAHKDIPVFPFQGVDHFKHAIRGFRAGELVTIYSLHRLPENIALGGIVGVHFHKLHLRNGKFLRCARVAHNFRVTPILGNPFYHFIRPNAVVFNGAHFLLAAHKGSDIGVLNLFHQLISAARG